MRRSSSRLLTLAFLLAVGCHTPPATTAPVANLTATSIPTAGTYSIGGVVLDTRSQPVGEAQIEVIAPGFHGRFVTSAADGRYELSDLSGGVQLRASKNGYFSELHGIRSGAGAFDFRLQPIDSIVPGRTIRATLTEQHSVCGADLFGKARADATDVRCYRFLLKASADGTLAVTLTLADARLGLAIVAPDGAETIAHADGRQVRATMTVPRGSNNEVRVSGRVDRPAGIPFQLEASIE
jgi:hypothetical protein